MYLFKSLVSQFVFNPLFIMHLHMMVTKDGDKTINEVALTWLGQGIDEGMHVTTW
jgi:hypothetical protein